MNEVLAKRNIKEKQLDFVIFPNGIFFLKFILQSFCITTLSREK